ncbi:MAG: hypothetical protein HYY06_07220 [Deltaproteobacteria bacterium]|nr:hypothetical protein [Deltaproteobacteria bacterium]
MGRIVVVVTWCAAAGPVAFGCSEAEVPGGVADARPGQDASVWGPDIAEPEPPAPPEPPELPRMTPCPDGWRENVDPDNAALVTCDPWPEGGRQDCAEDEAHFPGRPGCERIGPPCPEGEWAAKIPEDARVLYVRAGEPEGGGGTREQPFGWIADAVAAANDGDVIALSKGLFDEEVRIDRAVTLLGACVLETRIAPSVPGAQPAALTLRAAVVVRNLQVGGAEGGVDVSRAAGMAELDSVVVRESTSVGVRVSFRGRLQATDLLVREIAEGDGRLGHGVEASGGAEVMLDRAVLERSRTSGVSVAEEGTALTAANLVVADTLTRESDALGGEGLWAGGGAHVTLERAVLERNRMFGVVVQEEGTVLTATDLLVLDTQARESDDSGGYGLVAGFAAQVTLERAVLERNRMFGALSQGEGTVLTATDLLVLDTQARESDGSGGYGLYAWGGAQVTLDRAMLSRNRGVGLVVEDEATVLMATNLAVSDTHEMQSDRTAGYGLSAEGGAQVTLDRAVLERNRELGVVIQGEGTVLTAVDVAISDTLSRGSDGTRGYGLGVFWGARVTLERAVLDRNRAFGVFAALDGTALLATDLVVSDTLSQESDGRDGDAVIILAGASAELERTRMLDNRGYALRAFGTDTTVTAVDIAVERTAEQACAIDTCSDATGGFGLASEGGATLDVRRFRSADNALVGVLVASGSALDLHEGIVSYNRIGANVQVDGYDLARLQDEVFYADNGVNTDSTRFKVPEPPEALDFDPEER